MAAGWRGQGDNTHEKQNKLYQKNNNNGLHQSREMETHARTDSQPRYHGRRMWIRFCFVGPT